MYRETFQFFSKRLIYNFHEDKKKLRLNSLIGFLKKNRPLK